MQINHFDKHPYVSINFVNDFVCRLDCANLHHPGSGGISSLHQATDPTGRTSGYITSENSSYSAVTSASAALQSQVRQFLAQFYFGY